MAPKMGESITIEYTPIAADIKWAEQSKNLHAVFYAFNQDADAPVATEIPLVKTNSRWSGKFNPAADAVFGLIKVGDGIRYDNNHEMYWNVIMHGTNGRPVKDAHLKAAVAAFGMLPVECRRRQDFQEAEDELQEEVKLYPGNTAAQVNLVMIQRQNQTIDEIEAKARLEQIVSGKTSYSTVMEAMGIAQAYQQIGKPEEAVRVNQEASIKFPGSKIEEQWKLEKLSKSASVEGFLNEISIHLAAYPKTFAKQNLLDAAVQTSARQGNLRELIAFMEKTPGIPAVTYYQAVNYVGSNDSLRADAYHLIEKGLVASEDLSVRPSYISTTEWKEQQRISKSLLYFVRGAILADEGKQSEGLTALETSIELGGDQTEKSVYDVYVKTLVSMNKKKEAVSIAAKAIAKGAAAQGVLDSYRSLRREQSADSVAVETDLAALRQQARTVIAAELSRSMLNQPPIDGALTTLDGRPLKISDWKGKVVLIDFWATWCGPCRKSFPSMQKLYETYKNNPNVTFAIVNVWERTEDRLKVVNDFLQKNPNLKFPVYMDKDDSVVGRYGVTGIPTKFFLGKDGRIQFKEVGYLPEEQFIEESSNRIELLLAQ